MNKMIERFKDGEFVVNCKTEDQARKFVDICYDNGIEWPRSDKTETHWNIYMEETCYRCYMNDLNYGYKDFYKDNCYKVVAFDEFIEGDRGMKKFTKDDLKVGMLVECDEMGLCIIMEDSMYGLVYVNDCGYMMVSDLDDNFENKNDIYSINKVYSIATNYGLGILDKHARELLWEREEVKKLTVEEISELLGFKVKVVGGN